MAGEGQPSLHGVRLHLRQGGDSRFELGPRFTLGRHLLESLMNRREHVAIIHEHLFVYAI